MPRLRLSKPVLAKSSQVAPSVLGAALKDVLVFKVITQAMVMLRRRVFRQYFKPCFFLLFTTVEQTKLTINWRTSAKSG